MLKRLYIPLLISCGVIPHISSADAREWSIPLAGNTYCTKPQPCDRTMRDGVLQWSDQRQVHSVYFRADRAATLTLALTAAVADGDSTFELRIGEQVRQTTVSGDAWTRHPVGAVSIKQEGYVRVDIRGVNRQGDRYARLRSLNVTSADDSLSLEFVKNNDGNMFYWGRRGPSVHLRYEVPKQLAIEYAYSELTVPKGQDPVGSYFMANGFREGYFGIQVNSMRERRVLFSVWSPFKTDDPSAIPPEQRIQTVGQGAGVLVGKFGNEGSGGQSYLVYPWKAGTTYRFLTEVKPIQETGHTRYTCWFGAKPDGKWRLIASFLRPKTVTHLRGFHAFLENFSPSTGHIGRRAFYGNIWVRSDDQRWRRCDEASFSVDATGRQRARLDFTGGTQQDRFYLQNCGFFDETGQPGMKLVRDASADTPPKIDFDTLPRG